MIIETIETIESIEQSKQSNNRINQKNPSEGEFGRVGLKWQSGAGLGVGLVFRAVALRNTSFQMEFRGVHPGGGPCWFQILYTVIKLILMI
jgi:hypothetical protein